MWGERHTCTAVSLGDSFLFVCFFLGPSPRQMEVPRLGVQSELQLPTSATATAAPDP